MYLYMYVFAGVRERKRKHSGETESQIKLKPGPCGKLICGPCFQCPQKADRSVTWKHICNFKNNSLIEEVRKRTPGISDFDCICDSCRQLCYKRSKGLEVSTPAKKKKGGPIINCTQEVRRKEECLLAAKLDQQSPCNGKPHEKVMFSLVQIYSCFNINLDESDEIPNTVTLCHKHYCKVYNFISHQNCDSCQCMIKPGSLLRSCYSVQDLDYASLILRQISPGITISRDTVLCNSCYMLFYREKNALSLDNIEYNLLHESESNTDVSGEVHEGSKNATKDVFFEVIKMFRESKGFLLQDIYDFYCARVDYYLHKELPDFVISEKRTSKWLLSRLLSTFNSLISVHYIKDTTGATNHKLGTMLTYKHMDLTTAIHLLLVKERFNKLKTKKIDDVQEHVEVDHDQVLPDHDHDISTMAYHVSSYLRDKLYDQAKHIENKYLENLDQILNFDYNSLIREMDPIVWNFFANLTKNSVEKKHLDSMDFQWKENHIMFPNSESKHGRRRLQQRANAICVLQYIMNHKFNYPLHIISANCVKRLSQSSKLLEIMNKSGFCTSEDTLERFLEKVSDEKRKTGLSEFLKPSAFTVISVDNVDFQAPYASVTNFKDRSWHGTSIMAQQPKPTSEKWDSTGEQINLCPDNIVCDITLESTESEEPPVKKSKLLKPSVRRSLIPSSQKNASDDQLNFSEPAFRTFIQDQLPDNFDCRSHEIQESEKLADDVFLYILERFAKTTGHTQVLVPGIKCKFAMEKSSVREKSSFFYMSVLDEKADSLVTMKHVLELVHSSLSVSKELNHTVIVGDAKTFQILMKLKDQYGKCLQWLIPFPGDWHVLKNYQEVIMRIFWDAGLKDVAKCVHKGALNKVQSCSIFKRTHRLIIQIYEALYLHQIQSFLQHRSSEGSFSNESILKTIGDVVSSLTNVEDHDCLDNVEAFVAKQEEIKAQLIPNLYQEFRTFCQEMSSKFKTFKFWDSFLNKDCFAYIQLWLAIRTGNWDLRMGALKSMAPIFHAFDRQNYSKLIPIHFKQMYGLPPYVVQHFRNGAWVSSIRGIEFSSIGFDEAHEMLINRDCKMILSGGLPGNIEKTANTLQYQASVIDNFQNQLVRNNKSILHRDMSKSVIQSEFHNVLTYFNVISNTSMFASTQAAHLFLPFSVKLTPATKAQENDMMNFREIGSNAFSDFVTSRVLNKTSNVKPVLRKHRLKTFAKERVSSRKLNLVEKEKRLITRCYKRTMLLSNSSSEPVKKLCQFLETPRAICTTSGLPYKGSKAVIYDFLEKRYDGDNSNYKGIPLFSMTLPFSQKDACFIAEGMNIIYISPFNMRTFGDYAHFVVSRWITPYFQKYGYREVRILFDQVQSQGISPKDIERARRDASGKDDGDEEQFQEIKYDTKLPSNWPKFLNVRTNKQLLCAFLSYSFLDIVPSVLSKPGQTFITSGGFNRGILSDVKLCEHHANDHCDTCERIVGIRLLATENVETRSIECHKFRHIYHNHEESDTQIWLHVLDTDSSNVHIYSVDRDVGMVGLPVDFGDDKNVAIQFRINLIRSQFMSLNSLREALLTDSDIACIRSNVNDYDIYRIIQALFISSGCDFVSYFANIGKTSIFKVFLQYCAFITKGSSEYPGHLFETCLETTTESGLLSFYRLIGCVYFSKNRASLNEFETPVQLFNSISEDEISQKHVKFLDVIRKASWNGTYEDELLPSADALKYHWYRACWVSSVWGQSSTKVFTYPDITKYGWERKIGDNEEPNKIEIVWDSPENIENIRNNVKYLDRGCGCKGGCSTKRCSCVKGGKDCGFGCKCKRPCSNSLQNDTGTSSSNRSQHVISEEGQENDHVDQINESADTRELDFENDRETTENDLENDVDITENDDEDSDSENEDDYVSNMLDLYSTM